MDYPEIQRKIDERREELANFVGVRAYMEDPVTHELIELHCHQYRERLEAEALMREFGITPPSEERGQRAEQIYANMQEFLNDRKQEDT